MNYYIFTATKCACASGKFRCNDGETCFDASEVCDGDQDCGSGEDEKGCSEFLCFKAAQIPSHV